MDPRRRTGRASQPACRSGSSGRIESPRPARGRVAKRIHRQSCRIARQAKGGDDTGYDRITYRGPTESIVGGRFVATVEGNDSYTLTWFDAGTSQYRQWCFGSAGTFCDFTGAWNPDTKTMTWKSVSDIAVVSTEAFKSDNICEF